MERSRQSDNAELARKEELSLKDLIIKVRSLFSFLARKWKIILAFSLLGAIVGGIYAHYSERMFSADCTFVLDEGKSNSMGSLASLGLDIGKTDAGLFSESDNIVWLYTSRLMLQKALLTKVNQDGKDVLLINQFIESSGLRKELNKQKSLKDVKFNVGDKFDSLSMEQNAIIGWCVGLINGKYLKVRSVDKTQNIILVNITSKDQLFAKNFNNCLVKTVNDFYIETKTKKLTKEVAILQAKADSFQMKMNASMYQAASALDAAPYANPQQQVLRVAPQRKGVDVQVETALYIEITKNLEASKMNLAKETPLIQVIDSPSLPLGVIQMPLTKGILMGLILFFFLTVSWLLLRNWYCTIMVIE